MFAKKTVLTLVTGVCFLFLQTTVFAQLGTYNFNAFGNCPNANPNVSSQPANAVFSSFNSINVDCVSADSVYAAKKWNRSNTIDLVEYNQFTITPNSGYGLNLTQLRFDHFIGDIPNSGSTSWLLRSSLDNFSTNIASGTTTLSSNTETINLPASFTNVGTVIFRLFLLNSKSDGTDWTNDNVKLYGSVVAVPASPGTPTSNSPQCLNTGGVTLNFSGTAPVGETWYWQSSRYGTSTANSAAAYNVSTSGTYYVRSRNNSTLRWSVGNSYASVVVVNTIGTPVFANGSSSNRCKGAGVVSYGAGAANAAGIVYSLDAASLAAGNTIDPATGNVTYTTAWAGTAIITATASGCGSTLSNTHSAGTITVPDPTIIPLPDSVCRNGNSNINLSATVVGINYTLRNNANNDVIAGPVAGTGAAMNINTGNMGNSTKTFNILAQLPQTSGALNFDGVDDFVSINSSANLNPNLITVECWVKLNAKQPYAFIMGKVEPFALFNGWGLIMDDNGEKFGFYVNDYPNGYVESSTRAVIGEWIHVAATYNGSQARIYINGVLENTTNYSNTIPVTSNNIYIGSVNGTQLPFSGALDEVRIWNAARTGAQISGTMNNSLSGAETNLVAYLPFDETSGSSVANDVAGSDNNGTLTNMNTSTAWITRDYFACSLQLTTTPRVVVRNDVGGANFALGNSSSRCRGAMSITYTATAADNMGISYSLDAASLAAGNTINAFTGEVTYVAGWANSSTITATAAGCNGPQTKNHSVSITPDVAVPVFDLGSQFHTLPGSENS